MKVVAAPFTKEQATNIARDLRGDYLCETFTGYDGSVQVIYAVCIVPYSLNKRHQLVRLFVRHLNEEIITRQDINHYLDHCPETEYTVVAVVGNKDERIITPYLYPVKSLSINEIEIFAFDFLSA